MTQITVEHAMQTALQHHRAGQLPRAEQLYRQILAQDPDHVDALHRLGVIAAQVEQYEAAAELIGRSIALKPGNPQAYSDLGNVLLARCQHSEAIAAFRQALSLRPDYAEAQNNLGNALQADGQFDEAIAACRQALSLQPNLAAAHFNLANALRAKGQLDEALAACRVAISLKPNYPEAHNSLGNILKDGGQVGDAIVAYRQALALKPNYAEAICNLGITLRADGKLDEAVTAYRQAISCKPNFVEAYYNLGNVLHARGQMDPAIAAYRQAITLSPEYPDPYVNLANVLQETNQFDEAIVIYHQAIALKPNWPEAYYNLGNALLAGGKVDQAVAAYQQALALKPIYPEAHINHGNALQAGGQVDQAIAAHHQAIALSPDYPEAHWNLALALLSRGDLAHGWVEFEWRWKSKDFTSPERHFTQPFWDGRPLAGATILLHAEQGFGDMIQFIRYLPLVAERGGKIIVECQPELHRVFQTLGGAHRFVASGQPLPDFEFQCPLLSLPLVFGTTLESIPASVPYLFPDPLLVDGWRRKLADSGSGLKIALAWAGNKIHKNDRNRSIGVSALAPFARLPGIHFHSLQKGIAPTDPHYVPVGLHLIDLTEDLHDFADTAALIANLDLVISVDTSVAHLAGAMGKPVWVLLPFAPDWRWLLDRQDCPWYPTMRLFRQSRPGDWEDVIQRVADALGGYESAVSSE